MSITKITGAQRDFSAGELDESMKRADENGQMKIGCRQMSNWRVLSSNAAQNRPGRRALFPEIGRVEKVLMSPGNAFFLVFGNGYLRVYNAAGTQVFSSTVKGDGATAIPWMNATVKNICFVVAAGSQLSIFIAYGDDAPLNVPQVLSWDGVSQTSTWTLATFAETIAPSGQKRTIFSRISPPNITMLPSATTGVITVVFSLPVLTSASVGTYFLYCGRQLVITAFTDSEHATALVIEPLPPSQVLTFGTLVGSLNIGDAVKGATSGALGIVTSNPTTQNLTINGSSSGAPNIGDALTGATSHATGHVTGVSILSPAIFVVSVALSTGTPFQASEVITGGSHGNLFPNSVSLAVVTVQLVPNSSATVAQFGTETAVGPSGSGNVTSTTVGVPQAVSVWDDEVMNLQRGYPTSVFYDQGRLGLCDFPSIPSGIGWSAIGLTEDIFVSAFASITGDSAIFELAPGKSQVLYVVPGVESSEFVFCDNAVYYIQISPTVPLVPGSVSFQTLSQQGCQPNVKPQSIEQSVLFVKAGGAKIGAVQTPGAYFRPNVVDDVSEFHSHLFTKSPAIAIAVPPAATQFEELYAYILLANGTIVMARYAIRSGLIDVGPEGKPKMGWLPWNGIGAVTWISAQGTDAIFTTVYAPNAITPVSVVEAIDNTQLLDGSLLVNALPAPFTPPGGKGPLYAFPGAGGAVSLFDGARPMGTYQIDVNGFIVPQNNGGENLASATLIAGQPWTAVLEPFVPDAQPGQDVGQRMLKRRVSRMRVYVSKSTGFMMARLFSGPLTPTSPALGTIMNFFRITTWNQGDDPTQAPPLREEADAWRPIGRSYDPRVAVIKDTPGSLLVHEIGIEASV